MGFVVFKSLNEAVAAGYHVFDRTSDGLLVRIRTGAGWALAFVRES